MRILWLWCFLNGHRWVRDHGWHWRCTRCGERLRTTGRPHPLQNLPGEGG